MRELRGEDLPDPREAQADRVADLPVRHSVRAHLLEDDLPTDRRYLLDRFHERCELAEAHSGRLCPHLIEVRVDLGEHEQGRGRGRLRRGGSDRTRAGDPVPQWARRRNSRGLSHVSSLPARVPVVGTSGNARPPVLPTMLSAPLGRVIGRPDVEQVPVRVPQSVDGSSTLFVLYRTNSVELPSTDVEQVPVRVPQSVDGSSTLFVLYSHSALAPTVLTAGRSLHRSAFSHSSAGFERGFVPHALP